MAATPNIGLTQPARGDDPGTWDVPVNDNSGIIDACFGTVTSVSLTNSPVTLSATQAQASVLRFSGTLTADVAVTITAVQKCWTVQNLTTGNFTVTLTTGSGQIVGLPPNAVQIFSDGTHMYFLNLGETGQMKFWYCSSMPTWVTASTINPYLIMDGSTFSSGPYSSLNTFLGGNTLPDFRGYAPWTLDNQGGSAAGRITSTTMSPNGNTVGATGGTQTKTLITANLPSHTHSVTDPGHTHGLSNAFQHHGFVGGSIDSVSTDGTGAAEITNSATTGITIGNTGNGTAFNGMPPAKIAGIFVIKT